MTSYPAHHDQLVALKRIEGQIRGIQKMIEEGKYCVDILTQLHATSAAIESVEENILQKHLQGCVVHALKGKSELEKQKKITEVVDLISRFRRG